MQLLQFVFPRPRVTPTAMELLRLLCLLTCSGITGAALTKFVRIHERTDDGVPLECKVRDASPSPTLEWQDLYGNILPAVETKANDAAGRHIKLKATVTKWGHYRCVVKQEGGRQSDDRTYLFIRTMSNLEKFSSQNHFGVIPIVIITVAVASLVALVVLVALKYKKKENQESRRTREDTGRAEGFPLDMFPAHRRAEI